MTTIEQICYSTVKITAINGASYSSGTGFFFAVDHRDNGVIIALITNRHVVEGAEKIQFFVTKGDIQGNPNDREHFLVVLDNLKRVKYHPEGIDLCAILVGDLLMKHYKENATVSFQFLHKNILANQKDIKEFDAMEDIFMVGYPNGLWDKVNNKPIIRKGITATHPRLDYNGKEEFLIDAACFPGSSGSPVFLYDTSTGIDDEDLIVHKKKIRLLGILYAGPQHIAEVNLNKDGEENPIIRIPNNLGHVIKAHKILDFIRMYGYQV